MRKLRLSIARLCICATLMAPCYSFAADVTDKNVKEEFVSKDWNKVIESANIWKEQNKTTPVPNFVLAYAYYAKGDYQKVSQSLNSIDSQEKKESLLTWAEEFVNEYPKNSVPYLLKGDVYIRLKNYSEAIKQFDKAEELDPSFFLVYAEKGMVYSFQNNYDEAINNFTQAIKLEPNSADIYNNRGIAYFYKGDYTLALEDFNKAINVNSEFGLAYQGRGKVYHSLGKDDLASSDFQKVKELNPKGFSYRSIITNDPSTGKIITQKDWSFGGGGGKLEVGTTNIPFMKKDIISGSASFKGPGGVDSRPEGKIIQTEEGEKVSEKTLDDKFITSALSFLLHNGQVLSKTERGK